MKRFLILASTCGFLTALPAHAASPAANTTTEDSASYIRVSGPKPQLGFVLIGGAFVDPKKYTGLAEAIVERSAGQIEVFIPHFFGNFASPPEASAKMTEILAFIGSQGFNDAARRVFVGGHSQGGITANDLPINFKLSGLVLLGSYLPRAAGIGKSLNDYPVPVLTLGGELDGRTGINYLAREAATLREILKTNADAKSTKPVVVLPGITHMQIADGTDLKDEDAVLPEVDLQTAHTQLAQAVVDFIATNSSVIDLDGEAATTRLNTQVDTTAKLLTPFFTANEREDGLCDNAQKAAAPLAADGWNKVGIDHKIYRGLGEQWQFVLDKASVTKNGTAPRVHVPVYVDPAFNPIDISNNNYVAPQSVFCKLRNYDALSDETGIAATAGKSCAQINADIIKTTLATLTDKGQLRRLATRYGAVDTWSTQAESGGLRYGPITITSDKKATGQDWVSAPFTFTGDSVHGWTLATAELQTAKDNPIQLFAGANYCKVLAPARVIEWATLFGLR